MKDLSKKWQPVNGYEGIYEISEFGDVYSVYYKKYRKTVINKFGYARVTLLKNKIVKHVFIHRLVADNFITEKKGSEIKPQGRQ